MQWSTPSFPAPPREEPTVETLRNASLSRVAHGPLRTLGRPSHWIRGAVYDESGALVPSSQKLGGVNGSPWVPADQARFTAPDGVRFLEGTWLYGGHWIQHFGHFIIETLTTLWPEVGPERGPETEPVRGLVFHKYLRRPWAVEPWQERLLELAGHGGLPIEVVSGRAMRAERLLVPSRTVVLRGWAHPQARAVWDRMAAPFRGRGGPALVYLSRTLFHEKLRVEQRNRGPRSTPERDRALDDLFRSRGFEVVSPETLPVDDQLQLAANAEVLAGASGSALHLSAFAPTGTRVLEIGDERVVERTGGLQPVIDTVCGHRTAFVRGDEPVDRIAELLDSLDLTTSGGSR